MLPSDMAQPACRIRRATVLRWFACSSCTPITSAPAAAIEVKPPTILLALLDFSTFQVAIRTVSWAPAAPAGRGTLLSAPVAAVHACSVATWCIEGATDAIR